MSTYKRTDTLYCDFCGKAQHEVDVLIRGPMVEICDECIPLAQQRVDEVRAGRHALAVDGAAREGGERPAGGNGKARDEG